MFCHILLPFCFHPHYSRYTSHSVPITPDNSCTSSVYYEIAFGLLSTFAWYSVGWFCGRRGSYRRNHLSGLRFLPAVSRSDIKHEGNRRLVSMPGGLRSSGVLPSPATLIAAAVASFHLLGPYCFFPTSRTQSSPFLCRRACLKGTSSGIGRTWHSERSIHLNTFHSSVALRFQLPIMSPIRSISTNVFLPPEITHKVGPSPSDLVFVSSSGPPSTRFRHASRLTSQFLGSGASVLMHTYTANV